MTAIVTRYLGPTNTRGSRIVVESYSSRKVVPYDHSSNSETAHAKAALALILERGWGGTWIMGGTRKGWAFVQRSDGGRATIMSPYTNTSIARGPVKIVE